MFAVMVRPLSYCMHVWIYAPGTADLAAAMETGPAALMSLVGWHAKLSRRGEYTAPPSRRCPKAPMAGSQACSTLCIPCGAPTLGLRVHGA